MKALFDTNIVIDALKGIPLAFGELERYEECLISRITWIEILVGADSKVEEDAFRDYLKKFGVRELGGLVAERAVLLRQRYRVKIPDALIWATVEKKNCLLVTRNIGDFPPDNPGIRFSYHL